MIISRDKIRTGGYQIPRGNAQSQFEKRVEGTRLLRKQLSRSEVATKVGVSLSAVDRWAGSSKALVNRKRGPVIGKKASVSSKLVNNLLEALKNHPDKKVTKSRLWSRSAVYEFLINKNSVVLSAGQVSSMLDRWGYVCLSPKNHSIENCELELWTWLKQHYDQIVKESQKTGSECHFVSVLRGTVRFSTEHSDYKPYYIYSSVSHTGYSWFLSNSSQASETGFLRFLQRLKSQRKGKKLTLLIGDKWFPAKKRGSRTLHNWLADQTEMKLHCYPHDAKVFCDITKTHQKLAKLKKAKASSHS